MNTSNSCQKRHLQTYTSKYDFYKIFQETDDPLIESLYKSKIKAAGNEGFIKTSKGIEKIRTQFHGFQVFNKKKNVYF